MTALASSTIPVIAPWLQSWLWASCYGSILALAILALQPVLRPLLSARWRFALWLLVLIRFLPLSLPSTSVSLFNWLPHDAAPAPHEIATIPTHAPQPVDTIVHSAPESPPPIIANIPAHQLPTVSSIAAAPPTPFNWPLLIESIYALGALAILARLAIATLALQRIVRRSTPITDLATLSILKEVRATLRIRRQLPLFATNDLASPALVGLWRPRLLIPAHLLTQLSAHELRLIFLHEAAHLRRHDIAVNYAAALLGIFHWFNPLFWLTLRPLRAERELACDELVLRHTDTASYGHTLLKLFQESQSARLSPLAIGIIDNKSFFTRRIHMIAAFKKRPAWLAVPAVLTLIAVGVCTLTSAQTPPNPAPQVPTDPMTRNGNKVVPIATPPQPTPEDLAILDPVTRELIGERERIQKELAALKNVGPENPQKKALLEQQLQIDERIESCADMIAAYNAATAKSAAAWSAAALSPADAAITAKLNAPLKEVSFEKIPVEKVIDFLRDTSGCNIYVNWHVLESIGIDRAAPISIKLADVPLRKVLHTVLDEMAGAGVDFIVEDGVITISSSADIARISSRSGASPVADDSANNHRASLVPVATPTPPAPPVPAAPPKPANMSMNVYDIHTLVDADQQTSVLTADQQTAVKELVNTIKVLVADPSFEISSFNGVLVVNATPEAHDRLHNLLDQLTQAHRNHIAEQRERAKQSPPG